MAQAEQAILDSFHDSPMGRIGAHMNTNSYKDRQLILRAFKAAGDEPSAELLRLIPETVLSILNDAQASTRDRIRAAECIQTMQKIQLAAIGTVNQIKARRDRKRSEPKRTMVDWSALDNECDTPPRLPKIGGF
jgi:hypothetical protein